MVVISEVHGYPMSLLQATLNLNNCRADRREAHEQFELPKLLERGRQKGSLS